MEFQIGIKELSDKITKAKSNITTEEATKTAFVLPFLKALGYDIFDPTIVVPEFTADIRGKKGEKVDYAIMQENEPLILIEVKHHNINLDDYSSQLLRYYTVTKAHFGILTNGIEYRFYTDLDDKNKMDEKPFLVINLENIKEKQIEDLKQFAKENLNINQIQSMAGKKRDIREIQNIFKNEIKEPSDEFVRFFAKKMTDKILTQNLLEDYRKLCKLSFSDIVNELVSDKISSLQAGFETIKNIESEESKDDEIITTEEELEGFYIVKSLIADSCSLCDITYRDNLSYFNILYKDNNRKWICRLYFNSKQKYISFPLEDRKDEKIPLERIEDIYQYKDRLKDILTKLQN